MVEAFKKELSSFEDQVDGLKFEFIQDSIFNHPSDAIVSPANSFGFMGGGIDGLLSNYLGWHVQDRVQEKIKNEFDGELLVGQSLIVKTDNDKFPYLISAPTMRVPMQLSKIDMHSVDGFINKFSPNVYLAAKAIFVALKKNPHIKSIAIPGLGTGVGGISPAVCASMMRKAFSDFYVGNNIQPKTLAEAGQKHFEETTMK